MKKNISVFGTQLIITIGLASFDVDEQVDKIWEMLPEDPNGPEVSKEDIRMDLIATLDFAKAKLEARVQGITEPVEIPPEPEPEPVKPDVPLYKYKEPFNIRVADGSGGKPFCWLPQTGAYYGKNIKVEFNDGSTWLIKDGAVTQGRDGNTHNYNQMFYFCGTDFKPGQKEYNNKRASIFGNPGSKANMVTLFYNR